MTEGTLKTKEEQENEQLIQEMLRTTKPENIVGELEKNPVLHRGDETLPAPMVARVISSAGYVWVWDTRSYDKVPVLYYRLPQVLRQKRADGSYRFTTIDPGKLPVRGTVKCMLHKDDPNRVHYDEMGFRYCSKENMPNLHQLRLHMMNRHKQEWAAIEEERKEIEKKEDRALQHLLLANQMERLKPTEEEPKEKAKPLFVCDVCKADFGAEKTLEKHKQERHKGG